MFGPTGGAWRPAGADKAVKLGDYPRYPGARLRLTCPGCGWSRTYDPKSLQVVIPRRL